MKTRIELVNGMYWEETDGAFGGHICNHTGTPIVKYVYQNEVEALKAGIMATVSHLQKQIEVGTGS